MSFYLYVYESTLVVNSNNNNKMECLSVLLFIIWLISLPNAYRAHGRSCVYKSV